MATESGREGDAVGRSRLSRRHELLLSLTIFKNSGNATVRGDLAEGGRQRIVGRSKPAEQIWEQGR